MSWCAGFGGPSSPFWQGYREIIPEDAVFKKRRPLYEIYHIMNHYNLFGGGYLWQAHDLANQCLMSIGKK